MHFSLLPFHLLSSLSILFHGPCYAFDPLSGKPCPLPVAIPDLSLPSWITHLLSSLGVHVSPPFPHSLFSFFSLSFSNSSSAPFPFPLHKPMIKYLTSFYTFSLSVSLSPAQLPCVCLSSGPATAVCCYMARSLGILQGPTSSLCMDWLLPEVAVCRHMARRGPLAYLHLL